MWPWVSHFISPSLNFIYKMALITSTSKVKAVKGDPQHESPVAKPHRLTRSRWTSSKQNPPASITLTPPYSGSLQICAFLELSLSAHPLLLSTVSMRSGQTQSVPASVSELVPYTRPPPHPLQSSALGKLDHSADPVCFLFCNSRAPWPHALPFCNFLKFADWLIDCSSCWKVLSLALVLFPGKKMYRLFWFYTEIKPATFHNLYMDPNEMFLKDNHLLKMFQKSEETTPLGINHTCVRVIFH